MYVHIHIAPLGTRLPCQETKILINQHFPQYESVPSPAAGKALHSDNGFWENSTAPLRAFRGGCAARAASASRSPFGNGTSIRYFEASCNKDMIRYLLDKMESNSYSKGILPIIWRLLISASLGRGKKREGEGRGNTKGASWSGSVLERIPLRFLGKRCGKHGGQPARLRKISGESFPGQTRTPQRSRGPEKTIVQTWQEPPN